ncbi:GerAB/ArcD/ProY family transporter, partial [Rhodococcus rhodochrous]
MAEFLEHLDAMVMALWVMGGFFQISMWYYVTVISVAQCFHLSDYRPIVYSVGILIIVFSLWLAPGFADLINLFTTSEPFYSATMQILLPALTLIIGLIKRRRRPLSA